MKQTNLALFFLLLLLPILGWAVADDEDCGRDFLISTPELWTGDKKLLDFANNEMSEYKRLHPTDDKVYFAEHLRRKYAREADEGMFNCRVSQKCSVCTRRKHFLERKY